MTPEIRYAKNGEIAIGYTVVGEGRPVDLVYVSLFNNLETVWENPLYAGLLRSCAGALLSQPVWVQ